MIDQNAECLQEILTTHIVRIQEIVIAAFPNQELEGKFTVGSQCEGNGKVRSCLSFQTHPDKFKECIELTLSLADTQEGVVFAAELTWSDGKTIDDVIVCEVCPDCLEDLCECVDGLVDRIRAKLVDRMVELVKSFNLG
jgi:hypothetical protein